MVVELQTNQQLAERRRRVRQFWSRAGEQDKRRAATQGAFAKALGTSTTAICDFEAGLRLEFPNGKRRGEYVRHLESLEREAEKAARKRAS